MAGPKMVDAVIANHTHVVVGKDEASETEQAADGGGKSADGIALSADGSGQSTDKAGLSADGSRQPALGSDKSGDASRSVATVTGNSSTLLDSPTKSEPQTLKSEGRGWSPLLVKSSLIQTGNRFSSRQLDRSSSSSSSDWTPAGRPALSRRN